MAAFVNNQQPWFRGAFLDNKPDMAWDEAVRVGMTEPEALGWALTGGLVDAPDLAGVLGQDRNTRLVTRWTDRFGPGAYLYVLAGLALAEAIALRDNGQSPSPQQLRVMVALNGVTLPAGV